MSAVRGGIDVGGTKMQAAVVSARGRVLGAARRPTPATAPAAEVVAELAGVMRDALADAGCEPSALQGVGVGWPGPVDTDAGTVSKAVHVQGLEEGFELTDALAAALGAPAHVGNDVQVATNAEFALGAGKEYRSILGVFWGTGVGGGIVLDGKPWTGRGSAAEIGHVVVREDGRLCPCGRRGCMEAYAGRAAMEARARHEVERGKRTKLFEIMEERGRDRLTSGVWERALHQGDPLAQRLIDRALRALGTGVASCLNVLDVDAVVIGGGLGVRLGPMYLERITLEIMTHLFSPTPPDVRIVALGDLGGAIGAALLAKPASRSRKGGGREIISHDRSFICYFAPHAVETAIGKPATGKSEERADGRRARGDRTRKAILDHSIQIASTEGLEGLSIGRLAEELGVSKSGLFAHFGSKVDLQVATVQAAREVFLDEVVAAARVGGGVQEIFSLTDAWLAYMEREVFKGGCFFSAASLEFDGRPGPVRDEVASMVSEWLMALEAAIQDAQEAGHVVADIDPRQLAFELHSLGMGANWAFQLYQDREAFDRARSAIRQRLDTAAPLAPFEIEVDEGAARRTLRTQIARLERELATLFATARPGDAVDWRVGTSGAPRVLDIGDLEALRDDLAIRVEEIRHAQRERAEGYDEKRATLEEMVSDPADHKWRRVSNEDIGEDGCKHYHSTPRLGLVGMLMGWWRVKISSGCP